MPSEKFQYPYEAEQKERAKDILELKSKHKLNICYRSLNWSKKTNFIYI